MTWSHQVVTCRTCCQSAFRGQKNSSSTLEERPAQLLSQWWLWSGTSKQWRETSRGWPADRIKQNHFVQSALVDRVPGILYKYVANLGKGTKWIWMRKVQVAVGFRTGPDSGHPSTAFGFVRQWSLVTQEFGQYLMRETLCECWLKREVHVHCYLCFSQIGMMAVFHIAFRVTVGKSVFSPRCSLMSEVSSRNAE